MDNNTHGVVSERSLTDPAHTVVQGGAFPVYFRNQSTGIMAADAETQVLVRFVTKLAPELRIPEAEVVGSCRGRLA